MQREELLSLVETILIQQAESQTVELKSAHDGFPKKIYDTLSSFSNQDGGGVIIFGISENPKYEIVGVYDAQDVQKKIMEACEQMEPSVRALTTVAVINNKTIVSVEIPGVEKHHRPVFYKGVGRIKGSYIRVGDADEQMNEYEIYSYEAYRRRIKDELRIVQNAKTQIFDKGKLQNCLVEIKRNRKNLAQNVSDEEIYEMMGVTRDGKPTIAGTLVFSLYPQVFFPNLCVTAVVIPGTEMGDTDGITRFEDNKRITGSITDMIEDTMDFVRRNSKIKTNINELGKREDREEYPLMAVREALLNALIHRDYSVYTENKPVSIEMYNDRLVIRSPGGLYGGGSLSQLGKIRPETRNVALANMLELLHVTENRYSGIPTMYREMEKAKLPAPEFTNNRGDFVVTLWNKNHVKEMKASDIEEQILEFCKVPRTRSELIEFTGKSRYYTMSFIIQPLVDKKKLFLTIPDKPKSSRQKYYSK